MRKNLAWKLHTVMSQRGIRTATELYRRLEPYGIDITSAQLSRIVAKLPARLNTEVLAALMTELDCSAADLLCLDDSPTAMDAQAISRPKNEKVAKPHPVGASARQKASVKTDTVPGNVLGPKVSHLSRHEKKE